MPTPSEKRIIEERRTGAAGWVLVPLIEQLLERECIPEDNDDFRFIDMLLRARSTKRERGVFSPSMLGSCTRQAYFAKTGAERRAAASAQANGYFIEGNFKHFKWQFVMWKLHRAGLIQLASIPAENEELDFYGDGTRPAVEVRVHSPAGDFAGTIDVIPVIDDEPYVLDFKGVNLIDFQKFTRSGARMEYRVQIVGYAMIVNGTHLLPYVVKNCLLVEECKAGPISGGNPLGLHEETIRVDTYKGEVRDRLKELRGFVKRKETPEISCVSTRHRQFQECPFNHNCLDEVRVVEKARAKTARETTKTLTVARGRR